MAKPLVSVIITTKNSSRTLAKCLRSIKNQTYKNIELIVVDNNSIDNTKEIARKFTKKIYNKGPERSVQRNYGAKKAKGKYLLIHDSDIYFNRRSIEECVRLFEDTKCDAIIMPEKSIGDGYWSKVKAFERNFYVGNDYIETPRFFKKSIFLKIGGYDENLTGPEDWDLGVRLRKEGFKIERAKRFLLHDEGKLSLFGSSRKKKYYSKDFNKYKEKHPEWFKKQMNFFTRFPFNKLLFNFLRHPILTSSMILMKFIELISIS